MISRTQILTKGLVMISVAFVIGGYPTEEHKRRADVALSYSTAEIQVGIVDVAASPYFYGMTPTEIQLVAPAFIDAFKRAEKDGYDAVVPWARWTGSRWRQIGGGHPRRRTDGGLPARGVADRRQVRRHGLSPQLGRIFPGDHRRYGMEDRIVGFGVSGFDLPDWRHITMKSSIISSAKANGWSTEGAEVIYPMGISQCPVHIKPGLVARTDRCAGGRRLRHTDQNGRAAGRLRLEPEPRALGQVKKLIDQQSASTKTKKGALKWQIMKPF